MKILCILVGLVLAAQAGYHEDIGIPLAAKIKEYEDKLMDEGPEMESRIVGGEVASLGEHPYLVGLIITLNSGLRSACGSSLVTATRLLTAGHCIQTAKTLQAVLGSQYLFHGGTRIDANVFKIHPRFDLSLSTDYDIAVVYLPRPVKFTARIKPIHLATSTENEVVGEWATAAGWGKTSDKNESISNKAKLSQVLLKVIPAKECEKTFMSCFVPGTIICTSGERGVGTCDGDSGGPLIVKRKGQKILVGVTSYGDQKCQSGAPSAFTRVAGILGFIHKHL